MKKLDWTVWKPRLLYGAFAVVAFALSLRWTFPSEAVKERLIYEAGSRGWQIDVADVGPSGLVGVRAEGVRLEDAAGLKIPLDAVTASVRLLPLLVGKQVLDFRADLYDGKITGTADLNGDARDVSLAVDGVNLARIAPLRTATGLEVQGTLGGTIRLAMGAGPAELPTGRIDLAVAGAGIGGGKLPIPGMQGGIPLQKVGLGTITAAVKLERGKATAEKLEAKGGDAELTGDGLAVTLQPRLEFSPLFGRAKLRFQPTFWARSGMAAYQSLADFAKGPDGAYAFQVLGSLGHPRVQLAATPVTTPSPTTPQ